MIRKSLREIIEFKTDCVFVGVEISAWRYWTDWMRPTRFAERFAVRNQLATVRSALLSAFLVALLPHGKTT
jgi:hypothetical protein